MQMLPWAETEEGNREPDILSLAETASSFGVFSNNFLTFLAIFLQK